jgi:hypothetical protein
MSGTAYVDWHPGAPAFQESYQWTAGTTPNGFPLFTAPGKGIIVAIIGRVETLEAGAATVTVVKSKPGVSIANGVILGSVALQAGLGATALQTQTLSELGAAGSLSLDAGDTVGIQSTGTFSASAGSISVYWRAA